MNKKIILIIILVLALFLRVWQLDKVPVSLFGDELDVGYHAYSILHTGKDYTGHFLPLHFRSLAEFRTPLFLYSAVPTVALFGINAWGVRLPAAFFGVLSIWAFYLLVLEVTKKEKLALLAAFLLTITPWHIHYSRAAFEVTELLFFELIGFYCFFKGWRNSKFFYWSALALALTPWVYNTAKLFLPLTVVAIGVIWNRDLLKIPKKALIISVIIFSVIAGGFAINTLFGGGTERFDLISIFNNPTLEGQLGADRNVDLAMGDAWTAKIFHNKWTNYFSTFSDNYLQAYSTDFLFINGDPLPRQSPPHTGELYGFELLFLFFGILFFFDRHVPFRYKLFFFAWLLMAPIPSALTQGGGTHATRLILELPILTFLVAYGLWQVYFLIDKKNYRQGLVIAVGVITVISLLNYWHTYYVHYPWESQRYWHSGYQQAITSAVKVGQNYQQVVISDADEPSLIFFLAWSQFPPQQFQQNYPLPEKDLPGFGKVGILGKYLFPPVGQGVGLYNLGKVLPDNTLYLATQKEVVVNLIAEPNRVPADLHLIQAIANPDGTPAFYLFTKPQ